MNRTARLLFGLAALLLLAVYVLPLWQITLDAPQYPEGLGLVIEVDRLRGQHQGNLESINSLNHYIGMKRIDPDAIPELRILPWAFAGLIVLGLAGAAWGRRALLVGWLAVFVLVMGGSLVRFYQWGYDYGHNLDAERAIIKVPGMVYQPPLIGSRQMLNITASSWPAAGGYVALGAFLLGAAALRHDVRARRGGRQAARVPSAALPVALTLLVLAGCRSGPQPIAYGEAACAQCRMTASDPKFGAELVSRTGKAHVFDSIECLTSYLAAHADEAAKAQGFYVTDFERPGTLVRAEAAFFLRSGGVQSPMGGGLAAFSTAEARDAARGRLGGEAHGWLDVLRLDGSTSHAHR